MAWKVAVVGANGRLGTVVSGIVEASDDLELVARMGSTSALDEMLQADLVVDVTRPDVSEGVVSFALEHGRRVLVGTSGWSAERIEGLRATVEANPGTAAIVVPNFSLGSVVATRLATIAGRLFDSIEIIESHHAAKIDSPSGTAVRTAEEIMRARGERPVDAPHTDQTARGEQVAGIPVHSLRLAGVVARQEVVLGGTGEVLRITHDTVSSTSYESGIRVALSALPTASGVTVGLESLLGLDASIAAG